MGSKAPATQSTTQTSEPWKELQPYLMDIFKGGQQNFQDGGPQFYSGHMTTGFNPAQTEAQNATLNYARGPATQTADAMNRAQQFQLSPDILRPESNPYLRQTAEGANRVLSNEFLSSTLPGIRDGAIAGGSMGSSRQAIAEALAMDSLQRNMGDVNARIYSHGYDTGLNTQSNAIARSGQVMQAGTMPMQYMDMVGAERRGLDQAFLDESVNRFNYYENLPDQELAKYAQLIYGAGNPGGTVTGTSTMPSAQGNPFTGALGGAMSGASLAQMLSMSTPWGAALGAGIGLLGNR